MLAYGPKLTSGMFVDRLVANNITIYILVYFYSY